MTEEKSPSSQSIDALRTRFEAQSRRAQAYYAVMHQVRGLLGSDDAASAWMNQPLPALGGMTPAQLVGAGRENEVLDVIGSLNPAPPR